MTVKETSGMMQERLIELINNEIDGHNSASEHQELMQAVASDEHASKLYHDLLRTAAALKDVEQVQAPPYLKHLVMNSIHAIRTPSVHHNSWLPSWTAVFHSKPAVRYAVVFASGLCVGLLFLVLASPWQRHGEPEASTVSGSMALFSDLHGLPVLETARVEGEGVEGTLRTYKSGGSVFVEIEIQSADDISIELNSDPGELRFDGIRRLPGAEGEVNVTQGKVVLTGARSEQAVVAFSGGDPLKGVVEGRVFKGNVLVHRVALQVH